MIVCAQAGEVNSGAFDPLAAIAGVIADGTSGPRRRQPAAWLHVDGAFGLWAAASPDRRHLVDGAARADSWATDAPQVAQRAVRLGDRRRRRRRRPPRGDGLTAAYLRGGGRRSATAPTTRPRLRAAPGRSRSTPPCARSAGSGVAELVEPLLRARAAHGGGARRRAGAARAQRRRAQPGRSFRFDVPADRLEAATAATIAAVQDDGTCWLGGTVLAGRPGHPHLGVELVHDRGRRRPLGGGDRPRRPLGGRLGRGALEHHARHLLGVVAHRHVAAAGQYDVAGLWQRFARASGLAAREHAVVLRPRDRHGHADPLGPRWPPTDGQPPGGLERRRVAQRAHVLARGVGVDPRRVPADLDVQRRPGGRVLQQPVGAPPQALGQPPVAPQQRPQVGQLRAGVEADRRQAHDGPRPTPRAQLERHAAAHRVARHRGPLDAEPVHERRYAVGQRGDRRRAVARQRRRLAEAGEVEGDDVVLAREEIEDGSEGAAAQPDAVQQHERRSITATRVGQAHGRAPYPSASLSIPAYAQTEVLRADELSTEDPGPTVVQTAVQATAGGRARDPWRPSIKRCPARAPTSRHWPSAISGCTSRVSAPTPRPTCPIIVRGEGCYIWDDKGNRYFDGLSALFCVNIGHGRQEVAQAGADQARELDFFTNVVLRAPARDRARGADREPRSRRPQSHLLHLRWRRGRRDGPQALPPVPQAHRQPEQDKVIAREIAYHGTTMGALAATGIPGLRHPFEPFMPGRPSRPEHEHLPPAPGQDRGRPGRDAVADAIEFQGPDTVAAVILEPVQNAGGCFVPPEGYFQRIREICDEYDVLFISDEVICSWGRLGEWFGCQRYGYQPDIITTAKGITSAYAPMGAAIVSDRVAEPFLTGTSSFLHGFTFGGHPICAAVSMANIDVFERENLNEHVRQNEGAFHAMLQSLRDIPIVGDVRGAGYFAGIELVKDRETKESFNAEESETLLRGFLSGELFRRGLICRADDRGDPVIQLAPPLISTEEHFAEIEGVLRPVLEEASRKMELL